ncbi:uncharacterized protein DUF1127 [Pseudomonas sp. SJZ079]|uniref:DUF1127 domain-containing protein n=1 Tax=Pseudomonas sp. SJZ079 TaxID=2572887 RepID=UPI00119B686F|nr:DUF1127 domain-containing protein [Pseudomonas sp. SJZ079]TWC32378.1 uncharacterized protein DUF1127 [Pseudomonas sp. SJZ079]
MSGFNEVALALRQQELLDEVRLRVVASSTVEGREFGQSRWALFWRRLSSRRALLSLTAEQLADIGLSREQALREAWRPFWTL